MHKKYYLSLPVVLFFSIFLFGTAVIHLIGLRTCRLAPAVDCPFTQNSAHPHSQLRKIEGQSLGYKVARFFGLLER